MPPSKQLRIGYKWVALDLDNAVSYLGHHVQGAYRKALEDLGKRKNPEVATSGKRGSHRRHEKITDEESDELWQTTLGRIVFGKVVLFVDGGPDPLAAVRDALGPRGKASRKRAAEGARREAAKGAPGVLTKRVRWRVEKPVTGDAMVDGSPYKGERSVFDENGQLVRRFGADGRLIWKRPDGE